MNLGHALICAAISTFLCALIYVVEARMAKRFNSELVRVDSEEWLVDTILSATLLVGFLVAMGLDAMGHGQYNRYIDPMLVSAGPCATLIPIKVLSRNLREVLKIAPKGDVSQRVASEIEALRQRHGIECYSHLAKSGRRFDSELNILVAPGRSGLSSARMPCARSSGHASAILWGMPGSRSASPAKNAGCNNPQGACSQAAFPASSHLHRPALAKAPILAIIRAHF